MTASGTRGAAFKDEARKVEEELLDEDVEAICINLMFSYPNGAHELQAKEIAKEVMIERGVDVEIYASLEYYPRRWISRG